MTAEKMPHLKMVGGVELSCGCRVPLVQDYYRDSLPDPGDRARCYDCGEATVVRSWRHGA